MAPSPNSLIKIFIGAGLYLLAPAINAQVEVEIPDMVVPAGTDTIRVPLLLSNPADEIAGLQFSIFTGSMALSMVALRTTPRTAGWVIDRDGAAVQLYDPEGANLLAGEGPVLEFTITVSPEVRSSYAGALRMESLSVWEPGGARLDLHETYGSMTIGEVAEFLISHVEADAGNSVILDISARIPFEIARLEFTLSWDPNLLIWEDIEIDNQALSHAMLMDLLAPGMMQVRFRPDSAALLPVDDGVMAHLIFTVANHALAGWTSVRLAVDSLIRPGEIRLASRTAEGSVRIFPGFLAPPGRIWATPGERRGIDIRWEPPDLRAGSPAPTGFSIYRTDILDDGDESSLPRITVGLDATQYFDTTVETGQLVTYAVTAIYDSLYESEPTAGVPARWSRPVMLWIQDTVLHSSSPLTVVLGMTNDTPVDSFQVVLAGLPVSQLGSLRATIGSRVPPDWAISPIVTRQGQLALYTSSPGALPLRAGSGIVLILEGSQEIGADKMIKIIIEDDPRLFSHGELLKTRPADPAIIRSSDRQIALQLGTGNPVVPGDTGSVGLLLESDVPIVALQAVVQAPDGGIEWLGPRGGPHLPAGTDIQWQAVEPGKWLLIISTVGNASIGAGRGRIGSLDFRVSDQTEDGEQFVRLTELSIAGSDGGIAHLPAVSGKIPIGTIGAVFGAGTVTGLPGRVIHVPVNLVSIESVCGFNLTIDYNSAQLSFLRVVGGDRLSEGGLLRRTRTGGRDLISFRSSEAAPLSAGAGFLFDLVLQIMVTAAPDTVLEIVIDSVGVTNCSGADLFAQGKAGAVHIGTPEPGLRHFDARLEPTGNTHFVKIRSATVGGVFLEAGDEMALVDTSHKGEPRIVGAGRVAPDGSINIAAVLGLAGHGDGQIAQGATPGQPILFKAWRQLTNRESNISSEGRYLLGAGIWGENGGLTILDRVALQRAVGMAPTPWPDSLTVTVDAATPFRDSLSIRIGLPGDMEVQLAIYDLLGRRQALLHDGLTGRGYHIVTWDGRDDRGSPVRNGMHFLQIRTPTRTITRKLLLLR